jgi:lipopolysaccharide transport system ATP-binding protein
MTGLPLIRVENLGKRYRLGEFVRYRTLREAIRRAAAAPARLWRGGSPGSPSGDRTVWALRNVSFEVNRGDVVGVIGRNGAGKSTLLKILTKITRPTEGRATIFGRVGSLLEVGTGFHPELTGRENVFLNGAILGMSRQEIRRKFDQIVDFAGVEEFLDTPVKRYSSGMQVRLAFAVAAHLEPEILLVDEVLAVGDVEFQKKCLGKMDDVAKGGRTILFVSHNMTAVSRLCRKVLVLSHGRAAFWGDVDEGVRFYLASGAAPALGRADLAAARRLAGSRAPIITWCSTHRADGTQSAAFCAGDPLLVRVGYRVDEEIPAYCQINVSDLTGERLMTLRSSHFSPPFPLKPGEGWIECRADDLRLLAGEYALDVEIGTTRAGGQWLDIVPDALRIHVHFGDYLGGAELRPGQGRFVQRSAWRQGKSEA